MLLSKHLLFIYWSLSAGLSDLSVKLQRLKKTSHALKLTRNMKQYVLVHCQTIYFSTVGQLLLFVLLYPVLGYYTDVQEIPEINQQRRF